MKTWRHTCLRMPGHEGQAMPLILQGVGGCIYCGDPGPERQAHVDKDAAQLLSSHSHRSGSVPEQGKP